MIFDWADEIEAQIRQEALVARLGQVQCSWANEGESYESHDQLNRCVNECSVCDMGLTPPCPGCGAAA